MPATQFLQSFATPCGKKVIVRDQYAFSFVNSDTLQRLYNTMVVILDRNTKEKPAKGITS